MSEVKRRQPTKMVPAPSQGIIPERDLYSAPVLEARHLGIEFGGLKAVEDFNLIIGKTEIAGLIGPNSDAQQLVQPVQALVSPENAQTAAQQTDDGRFCGHGGSGAIIPASVLTPALQRRGERKLHQLHGASSSCSHPAQACANAENWS